MLSHGTPPKPVIGMILGSPYSGSTLLGSLLGACDEVGIIGEANRFRTFRQFESSEHHYLDRCSICATHEHYDCSVWREDFLFSEPADTFEIYEKIIRHADRPLVIDASKDVDWLIALRPLWPVLDFRVIVTCRSPLSFAMSELDRFPGSSAVAHVEGWRNIYQHTLRTLSVNGFAHMIVRYESLVEDPVGVSGKILRFLGAQNSSVDLNSVYDHEHHPLGGNQREFHRYKGFDLKRYLSLDLQEAVELGEFLGKHRQYGERDAIIKNRRDVWGQLSDETILSLIEVPGVYEMMRSLGYSLATHFSVRRPENVRI